MNQGQFIKSVLIGLFAGLIMFWGFVGCLGRDGTGDALTVTSVAIGGEATRAAPLGYAEVQLIATVTMSDATANNEVTWSSNAAGVATVNVDGVVSFVATGDVIITATSMADTTQTASVSLTVSAIALAGTLDVDDKTVTAQTGDTHSGTVNLGGLTVGTDYELSINSQNSGMTFDDNGVITIPGSITISAAGTYTVTATGRGNYTGTVETTFTLTVNPKNTLNLEFVEVKGGSFQMGSPDTEADGSLRQMG